MSLKIRMTLLLGGLLLVFVFTLQFLRQGERMQALRLSDASRQAQGEVIGKWIDLINQPARRFVQERSQWGELENYITNRDAAWAETNLARDLPSRGIDMLWVLDATGTVIFSWQPASGPSPRPPLDPAAFAQLRSSRGSGHFFAGGWDGPLEIWSEPIGADTNQPPSGWLLAGRAWNDLFVATLSRLSEVPLRLAPAGHPSGPTTGVVLSLADQGGVVLRQLEVQDSRPDFQASLAGDTLALRLLVAFGLLVVVGVGLGVQQWILRPLGHITRSLATENVSGLASLQAEPTELGRVARLVTDSFAQKYALQRENDERKRAELALRQSEQAVRRSLELRARLARDLHDGVIQSIYAAGLGLESAMSELVGDQTAARSRLQHCRQSLNGVIREVRGFINGLEPEQMQRHGFAQELTALARTLEALWPVSIVLKVDPAIAPRLTVSQEVHALQIARECISNALRHGGAKQVLIILGYVDERATLTIRDDGQGFAPDKVTGQGSGLGNLASRAREMGGTLRIDSQPGRGAAVIILFPLSISPA